MDLLLHPADDQGRGRPDRRGRLSTVGHRQAFRAFARAAKRAGVQFMVIGGTFRDVAVRAASTRDIDIVLIDRKDMAPALMAEAGFSRVPRSPHVWRYDAEGRTVDVEIAAVASSTEPGGPFSVAFQHAHIAVVEGIEVVVPCIEDFVILKLLAAAADRRRRARDLADVQATLEAFAGRARHEAVGTGVASAATRPVRPPGTAARGRGRHIPAGAAARARLTVRRA